MQATRLVRRGLGAALLGGGVALLVANPTAVPAHAAARSSDSGVVLTSAGSPLVGTFKLDAGSCANGETGSYFRMIVPGQSANGPDSSYISNGNSACGDQTYTLLSPGTSGGLTTGAYQAAPSPAFDGSGNSLASQIIEPVGFFNIKFSVETSAVDAQTGQSVPAPTIDVDSSGNLTGNLEAFSAAWNNQYFNQGSPKPDGSSPGLTAGPTGTYNSSTGAYTLTWTSQIVGGPFNNFTGQWHLSGTFDSTQPTTTTSPGAPTSPTPTTTKTPAATTTTPPGTSTSPSGSSNAPGSSNVAATGSGATASGQASPDAGAAGSASSVDIPSTSGPQVSTLAQTGMSIPLWIGLPPLGAGLVLFAMAEWLSRRARRVNP